MTEAVTPSTPTPFPPFVLALPKADAIPLVCDSPHSGVRYPADFGFSVPFDILRSGEDTDVHALWQGLPDVGGVLLAAEFPRSYIDPNRDADDIDVTMLSDTWPGEACPTEKSRLGIGLIWKVAGNDGRHPIYDRLLTSKEVQARIETYYQPYHAALRNHIERAYSQFGAVWHLNLHSMPANAYEGLEMSGNYTLADFVLGNRDGTTCSEEFTQLVAQSLRAKGYTVAINDPYKGVALIARLGRPAENRHSLQIEIHRGLYMDEQTRERSAGFSALQANLTTLSTEIAAYIKEQVK